MKVDGEEDIQAGLDLYEFSEVLRDLGCWEAVVKAINSILKQNLTSNYYLES